MGSAQYRLKLNNLHCLWVNIPDFDHTHHTCLKPWLRHSFQNVNGTDRYIEVKSTKLTKEAPFYFSALEYDFSKRARSNFYLYRVFNLKADPKLFIANGAYDDFCRMKPTQFRGSL